MLRFSLVLLFAICTMSLLMLVSFPLMHRFMVSATQLSPVCCRAPHAGTDLLRSQWSGCCTEILGFYMAITMAVIIPPLNIINVAVLAKFGE